VDDYVYPAMWNVNQYATMWWRCLTVPTVKCTQGFHGSFSHTDTLSHALDFDVPYGKSILAGRSGVVVDAVGRFGAGGSREIFRTKANYVVIRHGDGTYGRYFHLRTVLVKTGDSVRQGDEIGTCGDSGFVNGPHLHFDVVNCVLSETSFFTIRFEDRMVEMQSCFALFSCRMKERISSTRIYFASCVENDVGLDWSSRCILCQRGGDTSFIEKAVVAQKNNASMLLIYNNQPDEGLRLIGSQHPESQNCRIPVVFLTLSSGEFIRKILDENRDVYANLSVNPHFKANDSKSFVKPISMPILCDVFCNPLIKTPGS